MSKFNRDCVKGILRAEGTRFVNGEGEPVILTGYAISGWQNPEGFMVGQPKRPLEYVFPKNDLMNYQRFDRRRSITQVVRELCGSEYLSTFWDRWEEAYIGESDIRAMAEAGWNSVRVVLDANALLYEEPGIKFNEGAFSRLDRIFDWCETYKLYIILDMHASVGGINGCCGDALFNHYPNLLMDEESRERQIILWEELTRRYHQRWILAGYDLANEPVSTPPAYFAIPLLEQYYMECIERMRRIDGGKHIFFLEGPAFARSNEIFTHDYDPVYHNWAINVHIYGADCSMKELRPYLLKRMELNVPVWISECGSSPVANAIFFDICGHLGIGYCLWTWKMALDENIRGIGQILPKEWHKIQEYINGGPRPSYAKCQAIFDEYIENLRFEKCVYNKDYGRITRKEPDIDLPGAGYDLWEPDGKRYRGSWEWGNYLEFRTEDYTKLVWATDKKYPFPEFNFDCGPKPEIHYDPLTDLALELSTGEYAYYTVHRILEPCMVAVEASAKEAAVVEIACNGKSVGTLDIEKADLLTPHVSKAVALPSCECGVLRVTVIKGTVQIKTVKVFRKNR
ncbi:cellulase family glycosylhydrolase [Catenibacillus scindens]|uniref:glycoside hydrolase family 5 protein n=1 Tax=Catenibacillus scindens TaxID=673271 RepID=UPI00320B5FDF